MASKSRFVNIDPSWLAMVNQKPVPDVALKPEIPGVKLVNPLPGNWNNGVCGFCGRSFSHQHPAIAVGVRKFLDGL